MYDLRTKIKSVNELRYHIFTKNYASQNSEDYFAIDVKNYDASNLPPCKTELKQQILRSAFITHMWQKCLSTISNSL